MLDAESMAVIVRISVERFYIQSNEMKSNKQTKIVFDADYNFMFDFSPLADNLSLTDILNTFPLSVTPRCSKMKCYLPGSEPIR